MAEGYVDHSRVNYLFSVLEKTSILLCCLFFTEVETEALMGLSHTAS